MLASVSPLIIGLLAFVVLGGLWLTFYWRVVDPWLRRVVGRMVRATINRGEQNIWVANMESEESDSWRAFIIRAIQIASIFMAAMVALMIGLVVTVGLSQ